MRNFVQTQKDVHAQGLFISLLFRCFLLLSHPAIRVVAGSWRFDVDGNLRVAGPPGKAA